MAFKTPEVGTPIPDFSLPASTGQTLSRDSFLGKVAMVFVFIDPEDRDMAASLDARLSDFGQERSQLLLVVRRTAREARELAEVLDLKAPLLADASGQMAREFGAEDDTAVRRDAAVVTDRDGVVVRFFEETDVGEPGEAADALLHAVRAIGSSYLRP